MNLLFLRPVFSFLYDACSRFYSPVSPNGPENITFDMFGIDECVPDYLANKTKEGFVVILTKGACFEFEYTEKKENNKIDILDFECISSFKEGKNLHLSYSEEQEENLIFAHMT